MHELSLMEGVLAIVLEAQREHGFTKVSRITLERGALSGVEPEALRFCFDAVMEGGPAQGARLDIMELEALGLCSSCGAHVGIASWADLCSRCGGNVGRVIQGSGLRIKDIEVE